MNSDHIILRTTPEDVSGIIAVKTAAWPEESADPELITAVLGAPDHLTFAAEKRGRIVGFVDSFFTQSKTALRWEVDLLAVEPRSRGEKLGEMLVRASCTAGYEMGADYCRALIRTSNIASQKTFARCGFQLEDQLLCLYAVTGGDCRAERADTTALILPVTTMNYQGVWLESQYARQDLIAAISHLTDDNNQTAGVVIPAVLIESCRTAEALGYVCFGTYQWWIHRNGKSV